MTWLLKDRDLYIDVFPVDKCLFTNNFPVIESTINDNRLVKEESVFSNFKMNNNLIMTSNDNLLNNTDCFARRRF